MARYDRRDVQRIRIAPESTFGTDLTSDVASNFYDLRIKPTAMARETMMAPDETLVQRHFQQRNEVIGPDRGSIPIEAYWTPTNQTLNSSTSPTQTPQSRVFEALMGGYSADQGSTVDSGGSTTGATVTAGHGSRFAEGSFCGCVVSTVEYPRLITSISTDTLTWWPALPGNAGGAVHNSQTNFFDESDDAYLQVLTEAAIDRGNIWLLRGAQGDLSFNLQRGGLLSWSSTIRGAVYEHDDEITTPQGGSAIAAASYSDGAPVWGTKGGVHLAPTSDSTLTLVKCVELSINPGIGWIEVPDHAGTEGLSEWERDRQEITVEMTVLSPASDGTYELYHDAYKAETDYGVLAWWGAAASEVLCAAAPTMQIRRAPEAVEYNGLEAIKLSFLVKENSKSSDQSTAQRRSPLYFGGI